MVAIWVIGVISPESPTFKVGCRASGVRLRVKCLGLRV